MDNDFKPSPIFNGFHYTTTTETPCAEPLTKLEAMTLEIFRILAPTRIEVYGLDATIKRSVEAAQTSSKKHYKRKQTPSDRSLLHSEERILI